MMRPVVSKRRLARTLAFQALFELESRADRTTKETLQRRALALQEETGERLGTSSIRFAESLVVGTLYRRHEIDTWVHRAAPAFPVEQMPSTDRVALEMGVYELVYLEGAPVGAVINEAVELAKTFGGESSGRFVNGVLGTIAGELANAEELAEDPSGQNMHTVAGVQPGRRKRDGDRSRIDR